MELAKGRPADCTGRLEREIQVYDLLDSLGIKYMRADHEAAYTMDDCQGVDRLLGTRMCKNLFLCNRQKTRFYLLLMPDDKPFKTKELSRQIGSARLSFAGAEEMEEYLHIHPGAVSVMGLMNDRENHVQLLIDRQVAEAPVLGCHPCVNTSSICISTEDLMEKFLPAVHHQPIIVDLPAASPH